MANNGPFGFDPDDFDRVAREALDGISRLFTTAGERAGWASVFDDFAGRTRSRAEPETTGETGDGVWVIYTVDTDGGAHIEQVYPTELDALRANKNNTDPSRKVRFLPYGIAASVLDAPGSRGDSPEPGASEDSGPD
ncbi:hypothetical protein [Mycolicibacterium thermoresistibile]